MSSPTFFDGRRSTFQHEPYVTVFFLAVIDVFNVTMQYLFDTFGECDNQCTFQTTGGNNFLAGIVCKFDNPFVIFHKIAWRSGMDGEHAYSAEGRRIAAL